MSASAGGGGSAAIFNITRRTPAGTELTADAHRTGVRQIYQNGGVMKRTTKLFYFILVLVAALLLVGGVSAAILPIVDFTSNVTSGALTFSVQFNDTSTNTPTVWAWNATNVTGNNTPFTFSTGIYNPSQVFDVGNFSITLNSSNSGGFNVSTQGTFINLSETPPVASFTSTPTSGTAPLTVAFTDTSTNTPSSWYWDFGDGSSSILQNPAHTFTSVGTYTVALTVTNSAGSNTFTTPTAALLSAAVFNSHESPLSGRLMFSLFNLDREPLLAFITPNTAGSLEKSIIRSLSAFRYDEQSGAWTAENYNQHISFQATGTDGILVTNEKGSAGMQLAGIGRDQNLQNVPEGFIRTDRDRLEIVRGTDTEWYLNRNNGIEQGMTLASRPDGTGDLRVAFNLSGTLTPALERQTLVFSDQNGPVIKYSGLTAYDATGRNLPAKMVLDGTRLTWQVDDRNAVYPVTIDPTWTETVILTASDQAFGANFGYSVSISNDTAIVGAYNATAGTGATLFKRAGQAYIFQKDTGGANNWGPVAILNASDKAVDAKFGYSVSISNDTAIVGAYNATAGPGTTVLRADRHISSRRTREARTNGVRWQFSMPQTRHLVPTSAFQSAFRMTRQLSEHTMLQLVPEPPY